MYVGNPKNCEIKLHFTKINTKFFRQFCNMKNNYLKYISIKQKAFMECDLRP